MAILTNVGVILTCCLQLSLCDDYKYNTKYFETKVDHFSFSSNSNSTFMMRYLINDSYWSPKSHAPIFFYTGNEGDIVDFAQNTGFMWEAAPEFKALIVFAEHRYYGESMPFGNKSKNIENIGYLSSSQALMDYVELIEYLRGSNKRHKVVAFGGSYGGMLAAWMRMKYPATIAGAIAASAPIWQFTDMTPCDAFNRVLTSAYKMVSSSCSNNIRKSWDAINNITKTDDGKKWLAKNWNLCGPLKSAENITNFKNYLTDVYGNLAMINYPYPNNFLMPVPAYPVRVACSHLLRENLNETELLTALFGAISVYANYTGQVKCIDYSNAYAQSSLDDSLWEYQACSEMIMPMCTNGKTDMFEPAEWNLTEYESSCLENFHVKPEPFYVKNMYGGKDIATASNIIFSNGLLDPWSSGGVLRNVSETAQAVIIPEGAHHLDLRSANPADPPSVTMAREYYRYVIQKWTKHTR